jgi:hypothetical protein
MHKYQWTATITNDAQSKELTGLIVNPVELTDHEIKERISVALKDQKCNFFDFDYRELKQ